MKTARYLSWLLLPPMFALACCGPAADPIVKTSNPSEPAANEQPSEPQVAANPQKNDENKMTESNGNDGSNDEAANKAAKPATREVATREVATLGNGCFWCTEAVLEQLDGVLDVVSGYTGGVVDNPTYKQVCTGTTEHAEVVKVTFDPSVISYESLLDWFFRSHDPTTLNRQGHDVGTQYRSAIFFHSKEQQQTALAFMKKIAGNWDDPIVTEVVPAVKFWPAEAYHQDYFRNNTNQGYCRVVIKPKLEKLGLDENGKEASKQ